MSETREGTDFRRALDAAHAGGPERHHQKTAEQGKLEVRERVSRLVDPESFAEEALLANWEQEGLGADGVVTGLALLGGRKVALMAFGSELEEAPQGEADFEAEFEEDEDEADEAVPEADGGEVRGETVEFDVEDLSAEEEAGAGADAEDMASRGER